VTARQGRILLAGIPTPVTEGEGGVRLPDGRVVAEGEVHWLPPVVPRTTFAIGLNYADHAKELDFRPPDEPLVFLKGANTFIGHRQRTPRPADVTFMHYESELAVVIGTGGRGISRERALDHVAGYTVANDYAFRDYLENYYRPNLRVKSRDRSTPLGPWLVPRERVADPQALEIVTTVNGTETQRGRTSEMIFGVAWLIEFLSGFLTLSSGDVILTGTPHGLANVKPDDEVVSEVVGVGRLINYVEKEA